MFEMETWNMFRAQAAARGNQFYGKGGHPWDLCVSVWEYCEDVARRVAILTDRVPSAPLLGEYDHSDTAEGEKIFVFSGLFLALQHVMVYQPDRNEKSEGLFRYLVDPESALPSDWIGPDSIVNRWPEDFDDQYRRIMRPYRPERDPLAGRVAMPELGNEMVKEALFESFRENYIFSEDLDDAYEAYIRLFCRLTLELADWCDGYCAAMYDWCHDDEGDDHRLLARVLLHGRAVSAFGLRCHYAQWIDNLDMR